MKKKIIRKNKTRRKKQKGGEDTTQLIEAIKKGDLEQVKKLVSSGVDVNDDEVLSPLGLAAARGHLEIVKFLLDSGAEVDKTFKRGELVVTALALAAQHSRTEIATEIVKLLIERGADVNYNVIFVPDPKSIWRNRGTFPYESVLTMALQHRNEQAELVKALLDAGANPNVRFKSLEHTLTTPLILACQHGNVEIVEALLDKGADLTVTDEMRRPPIWYALHNTDENHRWAPHVEVIRALVNKDPSVVNQTLGYTQPHRDDGGATPLEYTVSKIWDQNPVANPSEQYRNLIELFLDNGPFLNKVISHMGRIGKYINHRIISKGLVTKEQIEELLQEYKDDKEKAEKKYYEMNDYHLEQLKKAFDNLDSQILKGIKDGSLTEQQAEELGFIEKYNEMLEKRELLEQGIEKMKKNAEENEEERVKNTGEKKRRFGTHIKTHGLAHEVEEFLGGKRKKTRKYNKKKNKSKKRVK